MDDINQPDGSLYAGPETIAILEKYAEEKDYRKLREAFLDSRDYLPLDKYVYWSTIYENLFGDCEMSTGYADSCLMEAFEGCGPEERSEMTYVRAGNYLRTGDYAKAAADYRSLLSDYAGYTDDEEKAELVNNLAVCEALAGVPPQTVELSKNTFIPYTLSDFGHIVVKVSTPAESVDFIFDTGANFSTVTESVALSMGMDLIEASIEVGTATGKMVRTRLAVAKELKVGPVRLTNVVFLVMPDENLTFGEIGYAISGVIGFPVISSFREITVSDGRIAIPENTVDAGVRNLCIEGLMPLLFAEGNGKPMQFTLDTGANRSELSYAYFKANEEEIKKKAGHLTGKRGGGGGVIDEELYRLPGFGLDIAGETVKLDHICISTTEYLFNKGKDGNIGLDILLATGGFTISFLHKYVTVSPRK